MKYLDAISQTGKAVPGLTVEKCEEGIAALTEQLKGPMSNTERAWLVMERKDLRATLEALRGGTHV